MKTKNQPIRREADRPIVGRQEKLTTGTLSTALGAVVMVVAFTSPAPEPTLQLVAISLGGLLIGGSR
jgi:hypothetical protein